MSVDPEESGPDRRSLFKAAAVVAVPLVGGGMVAACSSGNSTPVRTGSSASTGGNTPVQVPVADVPVGGGAVVESAKVVVTQPTAGQYKAFTAVCTHSGCTVKTIADNQIHCPCHGSIFSATDGSVLSGPATAPLTALAAKVTGSNVDVTGMAS